MNYAHLKKLQDIFGQTALSPTEEEDYLAIYAACENNCEAIPLNQLYAYLLKYRQMPRCSVCTLPAQARTNLATAWEGHIAFFSSTEDYFHFLCNETNHFILNWVWHEAPRPGSLLDTETHANNVIQRAAKLILETTTIPVAVGFVHSRLLNDPLFQPYTIAEGESLDYNSWFRLN